jgi:two-component system sensor histidine kinase PhcS
MSDPATIQAGYRQYTDTVRVRNSKVACALVIALMPAGISLDWFVYPDHVSQFLVVRIISSLLAGLVLWRLTAKHLSRFETRLLCMGWWIIPAAAISWMIAVTEGMASPYYAGLCLVILAVSIVIQATLAESVHAVLWIVGMYIIACVAHNRGFDGRLLFNNLYFLILTAVIVMTGNVFYNRLRHREFSLRSELAESQTTLEEQNRELAATIRRLTEAESQLVQSEKMASLGRMSAGIIHEINNPLNFATTGLFTLRKKGKQLEPEQQPGFNEVLNDVEEGIGRVKNIVSDLRMFTHPADDSLDQVEAAEVVGSAVRFLSNELKHVTVEEKLEPGVTVQANKNKLIHLFVNLLQNSVDALHTKPFPNGAQPTLEISSRKSARSTSLLVRDNGPGIAPEHMNKIFDPFYTTKEVGQGMGLGLSICYRIMQECQGRILVRTEPGQFCEFELVFPHPLTEPKSKS